MTLSINLGLFIKYPKYRIFHLSLLSRIDQVVLVLSFLTFTSSSFLFLNIFNERCSYALHLSAPFFQAKVAAKITTFFTLTKSFLRFFKVFFASLKTQKKPARKWNKAFFWTMPWKTLFLSPKAAAKINLISPLFQIISTFYSFKLHLKSLLHW